MEEIKHHDTWVADLPAPKEAPAPPHFSLADALEVVEGDHLLLREMTRAFLRHAPVLLEGLRAGLEGGDALGVSRNLRELEERAASIGALAFQEEILRLRETFTSGGLSAPASPFENLPALLVSLRDVLEEVDWEDLDDRFQPG